MKHETCRRGKGWSRARRLVPEPGPLRERRLDVADVVHGAGVVPVAREPGSDAAPEHVGPAMAGGNLPHRLPVVEPGPAVVEVAVVASAQPGGVEVDGQRGRSLRARHAAPEERAVTRLVPDLHDGERPDRRVGAPAAISPGGLMPGRLDHGDGADEVLVDAPAAGGP